MRARSRRHVRCALLVADEYVVNGELAQRIVDRQDGSAGIAEDGFNALAHQCGPHDFSAGEAGGGGEVGVCGLRGFDGSMDNSFTEISGQRSEIRKRR